MPSIVSQIQLVRDWAPVLSMLSAISAAKQTQAKTAAVVALLQFAAKKTNTKLDDDLLAWLSVALAMPEAAVIFNWIEHLGTLVALEPPPAEAK
jgi:hypothetical protein